MRLRHLSINRFRNLGRVEWRLEEPHGDGDEGNEGDKARFFLVYGPNGSGKTNLLDAVHYLCMTKSQLGLPESQAVMQGESFMALIGEFLETSTDLTDNQVIKVSLGVQGGKKQLKVDGEVVTRMADHIGRFPVVMGSPMDTDLIHGGSEERRRMMDAHLSQVSPDYLRDLMAYNKALAERNALYKNNHPYPPEEDLLAALDFQMVKHGKPIWKARLGLVEAMAGPLVEAYSELAGRDEQPGLRLRSDAFDADSDEHTPANDFGAMLLANRQADLSLGRTSRGPHRDDLRFTLFDGPIKRYGSQGQQKTYLYALRLTLHGLLAAGTGKAPLLLLDDVADRLDEGRLSRLLAYVAIKQRALGGQTLLTHTALAPIERAIAGVAGDPVLVGLALPEANLPLAF